MELIDYEVKFKKGKSFKTISDEASSVIVLLDIAHSLSIMAKESQQRMAKNTPY